MFYRVLLIYVSMQHAVFSTAEQCLDPTITVEYVNSCPESLTAWQKAAEKKNCSAYGKTCGDNKPVKYHCLMNTYRNASLQMCAAEVSIVGYCCPEYNEYGNLIQEHYGTDCKPCPFYYYSTEVYKYPYCFHKNATTLTTAKHHTTSVESIITHNAFENTTNSVSIIEPTTTTSTRISATNQIVTVILIILGCMALTFLITTTCYLWRANNNSNKENLS